MKYLTVLNQFLNKNKKRAKGYSLTEIHQIEQLYDIRVHGDLKTFLSVAGRSDGGLLGETIVMYRDYYSVRQQILFQLILENDLPQYNWLNDKPFIFAVICETHYFFIKTNSDDLIVYGYSEGENEIFSTETCFDEFMVWLINEENPDLKWISDDTGELLWLKPKRFCFW